MSAAKNHRQYSIYSMLSAISRSLIFILFLVGVKTTAAQTPFNGLMVNEEYFEENLLEIIIDLQKKYPINLYFEPYAFPYYPVTTKIKNEPMQSALSKVLQGSGFVFSNLGESDIIICTPKNLNKAYALQLVEDWKTGKLKLPTKDEPEEITLNFGKPTSDENEQGFYLTGTIRDVEDKSEIIGAVVQLEKEGNGVLTDAFGRFSIKLEKGLSLLKIQYVGMQTILLSVNMFEDGNAEINMNVQALNLDEVVVKAKVSDANVNSTTIGLEQLNTEQIKELPSFLGEPDIMKSLESLTGVSSVGEGSTGVNVRGGNIDQNLIVQDGALIFNSSHALGIFSVFNPDAVSGVELYKGHIPAQFGGRISSVIDVQTKNGSFKRQKIKAGVGPVFSRLTYEGPILKDRLSILAAGRIAYPGWVINNLKARDLRKSKVGFGDLMVKLAAKINDKHRLNVSGYTSYDEFRFSDEFGYDYGMSILNGEWKYLVNKKVSNNFKAIAGQYKSSLSELNGFEAFRQSTGMKYLQFKNNVFYNPNEKHQINLGAELVFYNTIPESLEPIGSVSIIEPQTVEKDKARLLSGYINDDWSISKKWSTSIGLRYSLFQQLGPAEVFVYEDDGLVRTEFITDTLNFGQGSGISNYGGFEPRFSLKYALTENSSLKFSYNYLRQYIHLVSNTAVATPVDIWQVSNRYIPPQKAHNFSIGYFRNIKNNLWQFSLEAYYKEISDVIMFKDLPSLLLNSHIETEIAQGEGRSFGGELSVRKTAGIWSGNLGVSYARTYLRSTGTKEDEVINFGNWFRAYYDQPFQINGLLRIEVNPVVALVFTYTYRTGRPLTAPTSAYNINNITVSNYSSRNQFRIPHYSRFDFGFISDKSKSKLKGYKSSITLSIYNLFSRENPFSVFFRRDANDIARVYQLSVIGNAFPALTYNFEF